MVTRQQGDRRGRVCALAALLLAACLAPAGAGGCADPEPEVDGGGNVVDGTVQLDGSSNAEEGIVRLDGGSGPPPFSFVALGDTHVPTTSCILTGFPTMRAVPKAILALSPAPRFVIHLGDIVDRGSEPGAYDAFVSCYGEMLVKLPLFPTMGNHDEDYSLGILSYRAYLESQILVRNAQLVGNTYKTAYPLTYKDDSTPYSTDFNKPTYKDRVPSGVSFKTFYAFRHANTYFISFEQGIPMWTNTPIPWVEKHLKLARADVSIRHVLVFMHFPVYISSAPEDDPQDGLDLVRMHYETLFRKYDVTAVFAGHAHMYNRAYVPDDGHATRTSKPPPTYPHDGKAIHYIASGGGSWTLDTLPAEYPEKSYNYMQSMAKGNHFLRVQVKGSSLTVTAIGVQGTETAHTTSVLDTFTIQ